MTSLTMKPHVLAGIVGYKPDILISPLTNEVDVYIPGIAEAVARLPQGARDVLVTSNATLIYRRSSGGVAHTMCDQFHKVKSVIEIHERAREDLSREEASWNKPATDSPVEVSRIPVVQRFVDSSRISHRGGELSDGTWTVTVGSGTFSANYNTANRNAVRASAVDRMEEQTLARTQKSVDDLIREYEDRAAAAQAKLIAFRIELARNEAKLAKKQKELADYVAERDRKLAESWVQSNGLRDGLVAVSDNPFVRSKR